jgi:hypothetical protein
MQPTENDFLYTIQQIGMPEDALYLYVVTGSATTTIKGLAVSVFSKKAPTATQSEDVSEVLEQVTRIYFKFSGQDVIAIVRNRGKYLDSIGRTFYYLQINPATMNGVLTQTEVQNIRINFYPYIKGQTFYNSDYNAIQNSVNDQQRSTFQQIADRDNMSIDPSNLDAILGDYATKAEIPDSNYTTTGWIRSRYNGVESTGLGYGAVPSSLSGASFKGSMHPFTLTAAAIRAIPLEEKVEKVYLHTGADRIPKFETNRYRIRIQTPPPIIPTTDRIQYGTYPLNSSIAVNDLLLITGSTGSEVVRIVNYDLDNKIIYIKRGVGDTTPQSFSTYQIFPIIVNRIYEVDGNRLNSIEEGKLLDSATSKVLKLDEFGVVYGEEI